MKKRTGREKVGEGAIGKMETQGKIATKPKHVEEKDTRKEEGQRKMTMEKNRKYFSVLKEEDTELLWKEENHSKLSK